MTACIRPATSNDIPELSRLYVEFHQFHVHGVPGRLVSLEDVEPLELMALADNLRHMLDAPQVGIIVGEVDGQVEGFIEFFEQKTDPHPLRVRHRFLYIQSLYVREAARHCHMGRQLIQAANAWGWERGLSEIQLDAWEFPGGPQEFYEHLGFTTLRRTLVSKIVHKEKENG